MHLNLCLCSFILNNTIHICTFRTNNNIHKFLRNTIHRPMERRTSVYKIICDDCDMFYIGQTGRAFKERFKEHLPKSNLNTVRSNYAKHLMAFNHNYTDFDNNFIPLYVCSKGRYMNAVEELSLIHIYRY